MQHATASRAWPQHSKCACACSSSLSAAELQVQQPFLGAGYGSRAHGGHVDNCKLHTGQWELHITRVRPNLQHAGRLSYPYSSMTTAYTQIIRSAITCDLGVMTANYPIIKQPQLKMQSWPVHMQQHPQHQRKPLGPHWYLSMHSTPAGWCIPCTTATAAVPVM
eukprot:GHRR01023015.1.p1 GENE.GHRR01023015.1~~GHRR01023015.1.p1  ORF type:complete len:164 (-),score=38.38 GHRR01023015.1:1724-2215(-)